MAKVATCLMFESEAEAAARFYTTLVPGSRITGIRRPSPEAPAVVVDFILGGAIFAALNMGQPVQHAQAASVVVMAADQAECDRIWEAHLAAGGTAVQCGWLTDRYGISWQVWPKEVIDLVFGGSPAQNARAMQVMMGQIRIDSAAIRAARDGDDR